MSESCLGSPLFRAAVSLSPRLSTLKIRFKMCIRDRDKSDRYLFVFGTVMGGVYEYVCSAVTELLFGTCLLYTSRCV